MLLHLLNSIRPTNGSNQANSNNSVPQTNISELDNLILPDHHFNNGIFTPPPSHSTGLNQEAYRKGYKDSNYTTPPEFLDPNAEAELHFVGIYEGTEKADHVIDPKANRNTVVTIHVKKSDKPIVLALSAYESVQWNIVLEEGAVLQEVITSGHYKQEVTGIPKDVKVTQTDLKTYTYGWEAEHNKGGGSYDKTIEAIRKLTGLRETTFQGIYEGSGFGVGSGNGPIEDPGPDMPFGICEDPKFDPIATDRLKGIIEFGDTDGKPGLSAQELFDAAKRLSSIHYPSIHLIDNSNLIKALQRLAIELIRGNKNVDLDGDGSLTITELEKLAASGDAGKLELGDIKSVAKPNPDPNSDGDSSEGIIKLFIKEARDIFRGKINDFTQPFDKLFDALKELSGKDITGDRKKAVIQFLDAIKTGKPADTDGTGQTGLRDILFTWKIGKFAPVADTQVDDGGDDSGGNGGGDGDGDGSGDGDCVKFNPVSVDEVLPASVDEVLSRKGGDIAIRAGFNIDELLNASETAKAQGNENLSNMFKKLAIETIKGNGRVDSNHDGFLSIDEINKLAARTGSEDQIEFEDLGEHEIEPPAILTELPIDNPIIKTEDSPSLL